MRDFVVRKQISIGRGAKSVWRALTDPDITEEYFFGCKIHSNWIVGDPIVFKRRILWVFPFELTGTLIQIDKGKLLEYILKNKTSHTESRVIIELSEKNGSTGVSIIDDVGQDENAESRYKRSLKGWDKILIGLKRVVENKN